MSSCAKSIRSSRACENQGWKDENPFGLQLDVTASISDYEYRGFKIALRVPPTLHSEVGMSMIHFGIAHR